VSRGQVPAGRIRNELGLHGRPVRWAAQLQWLGLPYGASGLRGFRVASGEARVDRPFPGSDETMASLALHCRDVWLPFLGLRSRRRLAHGVSVTPPRGGSERTVGSRPGARRPRPAARPPRPPR
jgi:hypothetical protein